jgi:hypothetical protein
MRHWRTALEAIGGACLVAAAVFVHPAVGLATAGVVLVFAANFAGSNDANNRSR